jgi:hypothetical protein
MIEFEYCDERGPEESTRGGKHPVVRCARHRGHEGEHRNGTWYWPLYQSTED